MAYNFPPSRPGTQAQEDVEAVKAEFAQFGRNIDTRTFSYPSIKDALSRFSKLGTPSPI